MTRWLLATGDFTTFGGMDRANYALASYLARRGDAVRLIAHRVDPELAATAGVEPRVIARPFGAHLAGAPLLARAAARAARALGPTDRALMNGGNGAIGTPTWIHYLHAAYVRESGASARARLSSIASRGYYLARERRAIEAAPIVICNSERTASDVETFYDIPRSRLRVVYYGCDMDVFGPVGADERHAARASMQILDGRLVAVFVGALGDRRKGFDVLFDAWQTLSRDSAWDVDLLAAGAGAEVAAWTARATAAGIDRSVRLLGFRRDIRQVLAAADVLVHPARYEAYGLGVHEALCRGIPPIVTAAAGVTERFPKPLSSLIVPSPPKAESLVSALRAWRAHAGEWRTRTERAAAILRERTWDTMAAEIADALAAA
jgi:glycosyltransferase involved in cell wall biosynthesis